jgi:thymidine kinase
MKKVLILALLSCFFLVSNAAQPIQTHTSTAKGKIIFFTGPMFASKTTHLIKKYFKYQHLTDFLVALKPARDNRYSETHIVSHSGYNIPAINFDTPESVFLVGELNEVIFIDEIQFVDIGIVAILERLRSMGKRIYVSGLDCDYRCDHWPVSRELFATANTVVAFAAKCSRMINGQPCNDVALYTQRFYRNRPAPLDQELIKVGGSDTYQPRCSNCWLEERS